MAALAHGGVVEEQNDGVPDWYNMFQAREAIDEVIEQALEDEDFVRLDQFCGDSLADPALPALRRAKYEIYIALCTGMLS